MATQWLKTFSTTSNKQQSMATSKSLRQLKPGKNAEEVIEAIKQEMKVTESRQGDVVRQMAEMTKMKKTKDSGTTRIKFSNSKFG